MTNILEGIACIVLGISFIGYTIKTPIKNDYMNSSMKGYMAGAGFIILGVLILTGYFK